MGMGALISFNMATAASSEGCGGPGAHPPASVFLDAVPKQANTDQWCRAIASFGGKWATLVAKHECGFALWPTKAESGGFKYNYSVGDDQDIVRQFAESCAGYGVKIGVYYSVNRNSYLVSV
jgi:alpha-L-fucosidase